MAYEVLESDLRVSGKKIIIIEGGKVGLIVAEHLASQGNQTIIVTPQRRVDTDVSATFRWRHAAWVKEFDIKVMTQSVVTSVEDQSVSVRDDAGLTHVLLADMVIVAGPRRSEQGLYTELEYMTDEIYMIGDCIAPRSMTSAIHEGYRLGVRL
jgi:2,4-dienoyl-CoA reductase (NADPH2)